MEENNSVGIEYEKFLVVDQNIDFKLKNKMLDLLTIYDENNFIYTCQPKDIFQEFVLNKKTNEIICVNWDSIDVAKMFRNKNYERYSIIDQRYSLGFMAYNYIEKKGIDMMKQYLEEGNLNYVYPFVILEEIKNIFSVNEYFVRGIICKNQNGYQIALNPTFINFLEDYSNSSQKKLGLGSYYDLR